MRIDGSYDSLSEKTFNGILRVPVSIRQCCMSADFMWAVATYSSNGKAIG